MAVIADIFYSISGKYAWNPAKFLLKCSLKITIPCGNKNVMNIAANLSQFLSISLILFGQNDSNLKLNDTLRKSLMIYIIYCQY